MRSSRLGRNPALPITLFLALPFCLLKALRATTANSSQTITRLNKMTTAHHDNFTLAGKLRGWTFQRTALPLTIISVTWLFKIIAAIGGLISAALTLKYNPEPDAPPGITTTFGLFSGALVLTLIEMIFECSINLTKNRGGTKQNNYSRAGQGLHQSRDTIAIDISIQTLEVGIGIASCATAINALDFLAGLAFTVLVLISLLCALLLIWISPPVQKFFPTKYTSPPQIIEPLLEEEADAEDYNDDSLLYLHYSQQQQLEAQGQQAVPPTKTKGWRVVARQLIPSRPPSPGRTQLASETPPSSNPISPTATSKRASNTALMYWSRETSSKNPSLTRTPRTKRGKRWLMWFLILQSPWILVHFIRLLIFAGTRRLQSCTPSVHVKTACT
jgi:hypothetical protein